MARNHRPPPQRKPNNTPKGRWTIGTHSVLEALKVRPKAISVIYVKEGTEKSQPAVRLAENQSVRVEVVPLKRLDDLGSGHQGIAALVTQEPELDWQSLEKETYATVLLTDGIQDPHNLGAMLRTGWLLGVKAIFISENRSAPLTPTVTKVASGGAEHVPVIPSGNLLDTVKQLKDIGFWVYGLAGEAQQNLWETNFPEKAALIVGSEESGLRSTLAKACDELVKIPQARADASFNASVALGISLSEVSRQHFKSRRKS